MEKGRGMINQLVYGDCMKVMTNIPDHTVDMILCDLPYGETAPNWDKRINLFELWRTYKRVIKSTGSIVLFATPPFSSHLIVSNESNYRYSWYWIKNQSTNFFHAKRMPLRSVEEICVFNRGSYYPQITEGHLPTVGGKGRSVGRAYGGVNIREYIGGTTARYPNTALFFKCVPNDCRFHSAEKPVDLCEYLIKTYTQPGNLVLDNCIGSGTTAIACINTNRNFIGIEVEKDIYEIARNRILKTGVRV